MHVRRIPKQEDVSGPIAVGLAGVLPGDAPQRMRPVTVGRFDGQVDAEHSSRAVAQLVDGHRRGVVRLVVELDGPEQRPTGLHFGVDDPAVVETVMPPRQWPEARDVEASCRRTYFVGHTDVSEAGDRVRRVAGEVDACLLAHRASSAVGADQIRGPDRVVAVGRRHTDGDAAGRGRKTGQLVAPPDVDAEFISPFAEAAARGAAAGSAYRTSGCPGCRTRAHACR